MHPLDKLTTNNPNKIWYSKKTKFLYRKINSDGKDLVVKINPYNSVLESRFIFSWPSYQFNLHSGRFVSRYEANARKRRKNIQFSRILIVENDHPVSWIWLSSRKGRPCHDSRTVTEENSRKGELGRANENRPAVLFPWKIENFPAISRCGGYEFILSLLFFLFYPRFFLFVKYRQRKISRIR